MESVLSYLIDLFVTLGVEVIVWLLFLPKELPRQRTYVICLTANFIVFPASHILLHGVLESARVASFLEVFVASAGELGIARLFLGSLVPFERLTAMVIVANLASVLAAVSFRLLL